MGIISLLICIAVVMFLIGKFRKTPVIENFNSSPKSESEITATPDDKKYFFEPSEDITKFIRSLIYIGKADGQLREDEVTIIADFLIQQQPEHKQSDRWYLISCIKEIKPFTTEQYNQFIRQLDQDNLKVLARWYKRIIETQKKNHPFEDHLLLEIQNMINGK